MSASRLEYVKDIQKKRLHPVLLLEFSVQLCYDFHNKQ